MSIQSYRYNAYRPSDVALLSGIASYVAVALDNARLFEEARLRAEELAILNDMGRALTSIVSLDAVIESVYKNTARMMDAGSFYVALYDPENEMIDVRLFGEGEEGVPEQLRRQHGSGVTEYIIRTREPLLFREGVKEQLEALGVTLHGREAQSWLGVPMITGDQVIGVIAVQNFEKPRAYDDHDRELLTAVASQAAIAIENARLFAQVQARARREQILREVTARVRGTPDVDTVMRTAAKEIGRALGRQAFVVLGEDESSPEAEPPEDSSNGQ
jgi:GAF domain-containing protein